MAGPAGHVDGLYQGLPGGGLILVKQGGRRRETGRAEAHAIRQTGAQEFMDTGVRHPITNSRLPFPAGQPISGWPAKASMAAMIS